MPVPILASRQLATPHRTAASHRQSQRCPPTNTYRRILQIAPLPCRSSHYQPAGGMPPQPVVASSGCNRLAERCSLLFRKQEQRHALSDWIMLCSGRYLS